MLGLRKVFEVTDGKLCVRVCIDRGELGKATAGRSLAGLSRTEPTKKANTASLL